MKLDTDNLKQKIRLKEIKNLFETEEFHVKYAVFIETKNIIRTSHKNPLITKQEPIIYYYRFDFCFIFPKLEATLGVIEGSDNELDKYLYTLLKEKYPQVLI
jgi:hypothetical protein